jgi:hypothetical protein
MTATTPTQEKRSNPMKAFPRRLPTPAMLVACVALAVSLGGASYAAGVLPKNSVGTAQLQKKAITGAKLKKNAVTGPKISKNAITSVKVKDGTLLAADFKAGQLPAGPKGDKGDPGQQGPAGRSALRPLQAGESESGVFAVGGPSSGAGDAHIAAVTFPIPLSHSLDAAHVIAVDGAPSATHCPGQGHADPGFLCVYVNYRGTTMNSLSSGFIGNPGQPPSSGADKWGFDISASAKNATSFDAIVGTWTYTDG